MQMLRVNASAVISELQSSDKYLQVRGKLCDTKVNLNGVRVTEAFIDEIVNNESEYRGFPLCADVRGLLNNKSIGHMYNKATGEFMSSIIGSMEHFEKETDNEGTASLIITAKIMKRYKKVCAAVADLFSKNALKFSFELVVKDYHKNEDGTMTVDANPNNYLEGAAIVTFPACEDAVAMELVAECLSKGDEESMDRDENIVVETAEETVEQTETAETAEDQHEDKCEEHEDEHEDEEQKETTEAESTEENVSAESEPAETVESTESENAEVYVRQTHEEIDSVHTYDTETGLETHETVDHHVSVEQVVQAEDSEDPTTVEASEEHVQEPQKDTVVAQLEQLTSAVQTLLSEFASLKESISHHEVAESGTDNDAVNAEAESDESVTVENAESKKKAWTLISPFVAEMTLDEQQDKYRLLKKAEPNKQFTII